MIWKLDSRYDIYRRFSNNRKRGYRRSDYFKLYIESNLKRYYYLSRK
jgi:hypothetical protein